MHERPLALAGQRVGLLGGSFDPPHAGHVHISRWALRALGLDQVWWLVSPGNPLKAHGPADIDRRVAACRALVRHPRIKITDIERHLGSRYTADTLERLARVTPGVRLVWLMGADNLAGLHRWQHWDRIVETVPMAIFARPGEQLAAGLSPAAQRYGRFRVAPSQAKGLGLRGVPAWSLLPGPMSPLSSTAMRAAGTWR